MLLDPWVVGQTSTTMHATSSERANNALRTIWVEALDGGAWPSAMAKLWPLQYHQMLPGRILFIGLNPSESGDADLLRVRSPHTEDLASQDRASQVRRRDERALGLHGAKRHRYFRQFHRFSEDGQWNHIDLLAVRHTNQSELSGALSLGSDEALSREFVRKQIEVCFELAAALTPPVVVVVNALAATLVRRHLGAALSFDSEVGHHGAQLGGSDIPWFFSGMLTGQRAIDNHSLERLVWHVQRARARR